MRKKGERGGLALVKKPLELNPLPKIYMPQGGFNSHEGPMNGYECGCFGCHREIWCFRCLAEYEMIQDGVIDRSPYFYGGMPNWVGRYRGLGQKDLCPNHNADKLNNAPELDYSDARWHNPPPIDPSKLGRQERKWWDAAQERKKRGDEVRAAITLLSGQPGFQWQNFFDAAMKSFRETNGAGGFVDIGSALSEMALGFRDKMLEKERTPPPVVDKSDWNNPEITDDDIPF